MYGLVNRVIADMVTAKIGPEGWADVKRAAGVDVDEFITMEQYEDAVTVSLVGAASARLKLPPHEVLEQFGEYWVRYTSEVGYGDMMKLAGTNFSAFLQNLDYLHAHVIRSMPKLNPPSFRCTDITDGRLMLHYYSPRGRLTHMVIGLLKGVGTMFDTDVQVQVCEQKSEGADHDIFEVTYAARA